MKIETLETSGTTTSPSSFQGVRYTHLELRIDKTEYFASEKDAVALFQDTRMHKAAQETFWALGFGPLLNIATMFEVNRGHYAYVELHMPSLIGGLLLAGCERFWLAHNHPSLDPKPSPGDIDLTRQVMNAANAVKLHFEDHLILTPDGQFRSMAKLGLLVPDPRSPYLHPQSGAANTRRRKSKARSTIEEEPYG